MQIRCGTKAAWFWGTKNNSTYVHMNHERTKKLLFIIIVITTLDSYSIHIAELTTLDMISCHARKWKLLITSDTITRRGSADVSRF